MPDGYATLYEVYENGVATERTTYYASGGKSLTESFKNGKVNGRTTYHEAADPSVKPVEKVKEVYVELFRGGAPTITLETRTERNEAGKPTKSADFLPDGTCYREYQWEHFPDGRLKRDYSMQLEKGETGAFDKQTISETVTSKDGLKTTTINGAKRAEGKIVVVTTRKSVSEQLHGDWKYWDAAGKLVKSETWDNGKLMETKDYK